MECSALKQTYISYPIPKGSGIAEERVERLNEPLEAGNIKEQCFPGTTGQCTYELKETVTVYRFVQVPP